MDRLAIYAQSFSEKTVQTADVARVATCILEDKCLAVGAISHSAPYGTFLHSSTCTRRDHVMSACKSGWIDFTVQCTEYLIFQFLNTHF